MLNVRQTIKAEVSVRKVFDEELVRPPFPRQLATGKRIVVFNIVSSAQTHMLNTGNRLNYQDGVYEIMNREAVASPILNYIKFNCVRLADFGENGG